MFRKIKRYLQDPYWALGTDMLQHCPHMMSDSFYLKTQWRLFRGEKLNLDDPRTLNEKLHWLKLHDRKPIYTTLVDKVAVKEWVAKKYGLDIVIPTVAIFDSVDDIDLSKLPEKFILKCNHDSGSYAICDAKSSFDLDAAKRKLQLGLQTDFYYEGREWPYKNIAKRVVLCEKLLETKSGGIPNDYKLHFINGDLKFVYVSYDRQGVNDRCVYSPDWERLPFVWVNRCNYHDGMNTAVVPKPTSFERMLEIGADIAKMFKYVRVDFYDVDGKLYFGEITMFHGGGYDEFFPAKYDLIYGEMLKLD